MVESKYEIRNDLPSARARRFESDERDLSPAVITTAQLILENWTRTSLRPYATLSSNVFSLILWSWVLLAGVQVHPRVDFRREPAGSQTSAPSCGGI